MGKNQKSREHLKNFSTKNEKYTRSDLTKYAALLSKDLDCIIAQDRVIMWEMRTLETGGKFDDITIGQILSEVVQEAQELKEPERVSPVPQVTVQSEMTNMALVEKLRKIDERLKKFSFYRNVVRPWIARPLKKRLLTRRVNASELMQYDGAAFVSACYLTFLGRQPEPEAMHNARSALADGRMRKVFFLIQVADSEEASQYLITLYGTKKYLRRERLRDLAMHLPVARRLIQLSATLGSLGYQQELLEVKYRETYCRLQVAVQRGDELANGLQATVQREDELSDKLQATVQREDEMAKRLQLTIQRGEELANGLQAAVRRDDEFANNLQATVQRVDRLTGSVDVNKRSLTELEKQKNDICNALLTLDRRHEETVKLYEQLLTQQEKRLVQLGDSIDSLKDWRAELCTEDEQRCQRIERFKRRLDSFYVHYEHILFPITEEEYNSRHSQYFERIDAWAGDRDRSALMVVDLGCGDGMWMKGLEQHGYRPIGIDNNKEMLVSARNNITQAQLHYQDAVSFLREQNEKSLDMISSFHMIEHMEPMELFEFFEACERTLKPGGLFVLETPNPKNILVATEMFYMDITHRHIIPWELLEFLMRDFGFEQIETIPITPLNYFPIEYKQNDPVSHMAFRFNNETAYSVWAVKPV